MEYQTILFKKNPVLFKDETEAMDALRSMKFTMGEPVVAIYGPSWKEAELILAIGKRTAAGESAFDIVATSKDTNTLYQDITNLQEALRSHEETTSEEDLGHVRSGRYIGFIDGYGFVKQLSNKLTFQREGSGDTIYDGSSGVSVSIPVPGGSEPKANSSIGSAGNSERYSREDHSHPEQVNVTGNSGTTTRLKDKKTITISGAVSGTVSTDFSEGNVEINTEVTHTHQVSDLQGINEVMEEIKTKAPIDSPTLTGTPQAPTPENGDNSSRIATTEFVMSQIQDTSGVIDSSGFLKYLGTIGTGGDISSLPANPKKGDSYSCISGSPQVSGSKTYPGDLIFWNGTEWIVQSGGIQGITVGEGLEGSGDIREGGLSVKHQPRPTSGNSIGSNNQTFVTGVSIDSLGHISGVTKANLSGGITAGDGEYVSGVQLSGTTLSGTKKKLPVITVTGGEVTSNQYVTGLSISDSYNINVTKSILEIPQITVRDGSDVPGQYVSSISSSGHMIVVGRSSFQEESGKVRVESGGSLGYLIDKLVSGESEGDKYAVSLEEISDTLSLSVSIPQVDGNIQTIKVRRSNHPGEIVELREEEVSDGGELFVNTYDLLLYVNDGESFKRLFPNATSESDGLMSAEDKAKLDRASENIGDVGNISLIIADIQTDLDQKTKELGDSINNLSLKITTETNDRLNGDNEIKQSIEDLSGSLVKKIQLSNATGAQVLSPTNGTVVIPIVTKNLPGLMSSSEYSEIYTNLPGKITETKNTVDGYTVNGIKISENPELSGNNLELSGYSKAAEESQISSEDTINIAIGKLEFGLENESAQRESLGEELRELIETEAGGWKEAIEGVENTLGTEITSLRKDLNDEISIRTSSIESINSQISSIKTSITQESQKREQEVSNINYNLERLQESLDEKTNSLGNDINDLKVQVRTLETSLTGEISKRAEEDSRLEGLITGIQDTISGETLKTELSGTNYLSGATSIIDALKVIDTKLHEIEEGMLTSELVTPINN